MPITINGTGSITGISAGGLPDDCITTADIAANAVTYAKLGTTEQGQLCKAWVNFNGNGVVAIRASYNVSSITDNGTGDYTVNFTTAIADANYSMVCATTFNGNLTNTVQNLIASIRDQLTGSCRVYTASPWNTSAAGAAGHDTSNISVAIFR